MKIDVIYEAFTQTLEDIAAIPREAGLTADIKCGYSTADLEEVDDISAAECVFGEIIVGCDSVEEKIVFECAVGIFENEGERFASDDEMVEKLGGIRGDVREFCATVKESAEDNVADAFLAAIKDPEDEDEQEASKPKSHKRFYIIGGIIAAAALIAAAIISALY